MDTTTPAPLNDFEIRSIEAGDLSEALHYYKNRTQCTLAVARRVVYAKYREVNKLPEPTQKFIGYYDESELPIKTGDFVTIRKGTIVHTIGREPRPARKTYKIKINHILNGVMRYRDHSGQPVECQNPRVRWPGPGGYWSDVDINEIPEALVETASEAEKKS
jgi:hypothetical protein